VAVFAPSDMSEQEHLHAESFAALGLIDTRDLKVVGEYAAECRTRRLMTPAGRKGNRLPR
jgi:hypothetical protein